MSQDLKEQEAQLMILLALRKVGQTCIYRAQTSKESWDLLRTRYSGGGGLRTVTVSLLSQVLLATFSDTEPLWPQLDAAIFAAQKLESVNLAIHDIVLAYLLALRLPESYSTLRTVLSGSGSTEISSKWVADQIIAEEHHQIAESGGARPPFSPRLRRTSRGETRMTRSVPTAKGRGTRNRISASSRRSKRSRRPPKLTVLTATTPHPPAPAILPASTATVLIARTDAPPSDGIVRLYRAIAVPPPIPRRQTHAYHPPFPSYRRRPRGRKLHPDLGGDSSTL